jgi:integrase
MKPCNRTNRMARFEGMTRRRGTGSIYKRPGCGTWTIKFYRSGKPVREATGLTDYQAARQKLNQRLNQVSTGTFAGLGIERIQVAELAEDFLRDYRINGRKSVGHAERRWRKHLEPFFGMVRVADVSSSSIACYVDARMQEGAQPASINRELAALKRMFRLGYYATPPKVFRLPAFPRLEENNVRTGFLEDDHYVKLTAEATELWLRAFIEVAHTYGWRKRELLNLRVRQVDLKARTIRLDPGATKNGDGREITMTDTVHVLLAQCVQGKRPDDSVFTRADGKPVRDFRKAWRNLCAAAGVPGLLVHDMRRTAARNFRRAGVAEGVIMRVGGWKTPSVFERYNIVDQRDIREALHKLEQAQNQAKSEFGHDYGHDCHGPDAVDTPCVNGKVN